MIFFRNFIFTYFDKRLLTHRAVIPYIEAALIAVIIISAILVIIALTPRLAQGRYTLNIITGLLLALSLCWSLSNYCFIFLDLALCTAAAGDINDYRPHRAVSPLARHYRFYAAAMGDRLAGGNTAPLSHRDPLLILWAILPRFCCMADVFCSAGMTKHGIPTGRICSLFSGWKVSPTGCLNRNR